MADIIPCDFKCSRGYLRELSFSNTNPVTPGNSTTVTLNNVSSVPNGIYYITITGASGSLARARVLYACCATGNASGLLPRSRYLKLIAGGSVTFNVGAPSAISYQWQISTDAGFVYSNISLGGNSSALTLSNTLQLSNNKYRCVVRGQCNTVTSNVVVVTVIGQPGINSQPQMQVCVQEETHCLPLMLQDQLLPTSAG